MKKTSKGSLWQQKKRAREAPPFAHGVEFVLLDSLTEAQNGAGAVADEDEGFGGWFQGHVRIVTCPRVPSLEGLIVFCICCGRLPSRSPYWIYHAPAGSVRMDMVEKSMVIPKEAAICTPTRLKSPLAASDIEYLLDECAVQFTAPTIQLATARRLLKPILDGGHEMVMNNGLDLHQFSWIVEHSDLSRAPLVAQLFDAFLRHHIGHDGQKQRQILRALPLADLQRLVDQLRREPWELLWPRTMKRQYGGLKPIAQIGAKPQTLVEQCALRYLAALRHAQEAQHTFFGPATFHGILPCLMRDQRVALERDLLAYLQERDLVFFPPSAPQIQSAVAFHKDYQDAQQICVALDYIAQRSRGQNGALSLRDRNEVPCLPPRLTSDQMAIARHITQHWLTVVLGSPGTGKTSLLTWALSHYAKSLSTGFVGRLVKMLQKRNGRRPELAYTIDALLWAVHNPRNAYQQQQGGSARQWLASFEVLIIDECSNISMGRIAKLLPLFSGLRKLVLVGDPNQLASLKPGDFLFDMARHFPQHTFRLTQNLRVAPHLVSLQEAPSRILHKQARQIAWAQGPNPLAAGPISHCSFSGGGGEGLQSLYGSILSTASPPKSLLDLQILTLTHKGPFGRETLNKAFHQAAERLGILRPPVSSAAKFHINHKLTAVYAGCKLTCLHNYNQPIVKEFGNREALRIVSDPVANGELFLVHRIWRPPAPARGICMEIVDSLVDGKSKHIWVDESEGVSPMDLDWGYATTVYKSQGGEFPWVLMCVPPNPGAHWTRANAYVGISRAQEACVILGNVQDFYAICDRADLVRHTVFGQLLSENPLTKMHEPLPWTEDIVSDPETQCKLLAEDVPAAPLLKDFVRNEK